LGFRIDNDLFLENGLIPASCLISHRGPLKVYTVDVPFQGEFMRLYLFALSALLPLVVALPSRAAEKPRTAQANQTQTKKVWTNDDLDQLRSRGLISIVGPEEPQPNETAAQAATAPMEPASPVYNSRLEDPTWYAEKAADLQAELDKRQAALQAQQDALANAVKGVTQPGVAMDQPSAGVTPDAGLAILSAQVQEIQDQMDELSDLARQNNIQPGILRG